MLGRPSRRLGTTCRQHARQGAAAADGALPHAAPREGADIQKIASGEFAGDVVDGVLCRALVPRGAISTWSADHAELSALDAGLQAGIAERERLESVWVEAAASLE